MAGLSLWLQPAHCRPGLEHRWVRGKRRAAFEYGAVAFALGTCGERREICATYAASLHAVQSRIQLLLAFKLLWRSCDGGTARLPALLRGAQPRTAEIPPHLRGH